MSIFEKNDKDVYHYIEKHISISIDEKNKFGEVFTSSELIQEMIDAFPNELWKNPHLKIFDPCAGYGNFSALLYVKLMDSLKDVIKSRNKRKRHIVQNMLYMVELNPKNVHALRLLFGQKANISLANFLEQSEKWKRDLGVVSFDIILGNPPFQTPKSTTYKGSVGNRTLWDKFLEFIFENQLLKENKYLGFITPCNWRRPEHSLYPRMTQSNSLLYLHIFDKKEGLEKLGAQTRFDLYIIQQGKHDKKTHIVDLKGKTHNMDVSKWPFLPNYYYNNIRKLLVPKKKGLPILFHAGTYDARKLSKKKTNKNRYPIVHNITRRGLGLKYAKQKKDHFGTPKVLLNFNEKQYPYNDYQGKYGMSQLTFGIPIKSKKQGERIIQVLNSDEFKEILNATKWSSFQTDYRMFSYFDKNYFKK